MRERVRQLRGTFQIEPGSPGTRVWVMLPVSPHQL
jgi:signal transduction histidine kinase